MARRKKYNSGVYTPSFPEKYKGQHAPRWRSSWELQLFRLADMHPNVVAWASEAIKIPYYNPIKQKTAMYTPDVLMVFEDKNGNRRNELIEIKPSKHTNLEEAKTAYDKAQFVINVAKWKAAQEFCKNHGMTFRVINENDIFRTKKQKKTQKK